MPIGTIVNVFAIIAGSLIGIYLQRLFPKRIQHVIFQGLGLSVLLIGFQMAFKAENILTIIFSMIIGGILGEALYLEAKVESFGHFLQTKTKSHSSHFVEGFVAASILYCVGALAVLGPIQEGLKQDRTILYTKSVIDAFSSIALASTYGVGVLFGFIPVLLYQGSLTFLAAFLQPIFTPFMISQLTSVGGLLIIGIALNLLEITKIKITNLLPALFIITLLSLFIH